MRLAAARQDRARALCALLGLLALSGAARAERLPISTYTSADGLGSSFVNYAMRDSRGFLWFCTRDGLSRFDGSRFVTYQVGDKNAPPGIEHILETRRGIYWIATTGGLYRFDPNAPIRNGTPGIGQPTLNAKWMGDWRGFLYEDRSGNVWSGGGALYRMIEKDEKVSFEKIELNLPPNLSGELGVTAAYEGQDGSLWLITTWGLVRRLPDGREVFYSVESSRTDALTSGLEDRDGRIWLGRPSGAYVIKPESLDELTQLGGLTVRKLDVLARTRPHGAKQVRLPERPGEIIKFADLERHAYGKFLYQTTDGHIWVSAGNGVVEYDGRSFQPHTAAQDLLKGVGPMVEDKSGNLWLSWSTGLFRLDRRGLTTYDLADGLKSATIFALNESRDGNLYAATGNFFLSQFDGKGFQTIRPALPPSARSMWNSKTVFQDHTGEWWVLTNEKLYRFAASRDFSALARQRPLAAYSSRDGLKGDQMFHIFEDSKGDLWISVRYSIAAQCGLSRWNRATEKFYTFSAAEGFPSDKSPCSFTEDRDGTLWLGFYEGGLARYANGRFTEFTTADGLPDGLIAALHLDQEGRLWAASALGGLSRVDDPAAVRPRFVNYSTDNGLASNNVRSITEDLYGNIYAGTARGVERLSPDATRIKHYSVKNGLAGDFVNVAFRDRSGALWFGTPNGLSRLIPEAEANTTAPTVWLGGLRIAGETRSVPELGGAEILDLELAPAQNNLQIDFFAIDFNAGEGLHYQYMLEGADNNWSAPTEQRTVNYANLGPGSYRYLVRAVNGEGVASARPASVSFRVLAPIWRRWWFLTLAGILIVTIIFAFDRYRAARMKEVKDALTKSTMLTVELAVKQEDLRRANRTLALEYEVTSILAESATVSDAAPRILQAICESTGWEIGELWDADPQAGVLRCVDVWHLEMKDAAEFETHSKTITFLPNVGLPGRVLASGEPIWITDLAADTNFPRMPFAVKEGLRSGFGFPILLGNEVLGVLEFFSRETRERDHDLLDTVSSIGSRIGQLLERKRTEQKLRESESRFRTLAETASDAIITIDQQSTIIFVNPAAEGVFGYAASEMLGRDLTILMPEYLRHLHRAGFTKYLETGQRHLSWEAIELPGLHKMGREIPLEISFGEFVRNGRHFFTGVARDITERKRAEEALRRSREERFIEIEQVRKRIATDLHDDIGSSLTQISILSEVAQREIAGDDSSATKPLSMIASASRELVDSMSDIVWAINPQKDHLSDLTQRMRLFASDIFTGSNIKFRFDAPGADQDVRIGANVRREVFLIFKESVNNLVRHSGCTEAEIEFRVEDDWLALRVSDNGEGFDASRQSDGHGLMSMRDRARDTGGEFEVLSGNGKGTTVNLKLPFSAGPPPVS